MQNPLLCLLSQTSSAVTKQFLMNFRMILSSIFAILISPPTSVLGLLPSIPNTAARVSLYVLSLLGSGPWDDIYFSWSKSPSPQHGFRGPYALSPPHLLTSPSHSSPHCSLLSSRRWQECDALEPSTSSSLYPNTLPFHKCFLVIICSNLTINKAYPDHSI